MNNKSQTMLAKANSCMLPIIPFEGAVINDAHGLYLVDVDGNELLDVNGGQFSNIFGYDDVGFLQAIENCTKSLLHINTGMLSAKVINSMELLCNTAKEMDPMGITLSTGSEAVEFAIRYSKKATGRNGVISFDNGYHGLTLGSQSLTYGGQYALPLVNQTHKVKFNIDEPQQMVDELAAILTNHNDISCFVIEPFVGVGGMYPIPQDILQQFRNLCDEHNILLVFDECQSGFGRTGSWHYFQKVGIIPDILILAKGIGNGFPVSAVLIKKAILNQYPYNLTNYSSHQNDPISAQIIEYSVPKVDQLLPEIIKKGEHFKQILATIDSPYIKNIRGEGLMVGFDIDQDFTSSKEFYVVFKKVCLDNGLVIQGTNGGSVIRFLPAYTISYEQLDSAKSIIECSIAKAISEVSSNV